MYFSIFCIAPMSIYMYWQVIKMKVTKANEDYLETILILENENKTSIKSIDIAKSLNVSKPAVTKASNELKELGLINKDKYGEITLTSKGRKIANDVYSKHVTIKNFLLKLGVSEEIAELDCCKIEHILSEETINKIKEYNDK